LQQVYEGPVVSRSAIGKLKASCSGDDLSDGPAVYLRPRSSFPEHTKKAFLVVVLLEELFGRSEYRKVV